MMPDRKKVIEGLESCITACSGNFVCLDCKYSHDYGGGCEIELLKDAVALLKAFDVTPEELERLKMCRAECKIDCLLESYNRIVEERETLLKPQESHVMTLDGIRDALKMPVWKETKSNHKNLYTGWVIAYDIQTGQGITGERLGMSEPSGRVVWYRLDDYGKTWRCWTSRPTDEQREATPWG